MTNPLDYLRKWNLADPYPLAETATSHLYKVSWNGQSAVLKVFTPVGAQDESAGSIALRYFNGNAAVRLLRYDGQAQLLEYIEGEDLKSLVQRGEDRNATIIAAEILNKLHYNGKEQIPEGLMSLETRFRSLFEKASYDIRGGTASVYTRGADIARKLLSTQQNLVVLHGDLHHENLKFSSTRGWLAIDPKGLYGERTYDAANLLCNPTGMNDLVTNETRLLQSAELLSAAFQTDIARLLAFTFAHAALSASWSLEDRQDPTLALQIAAIIQSNLSP